MPEVLREGGRPKKLPTLVSDAIGRRHMSGRTEESYVRWIKRLHRPQGLPDPSIAPTHIDGDFGALTGIGKSARPLLRRRRLAQDARPYGSSRSPCSVTPLR